MATEGATPVRSEAEPGPLNRSASTSPVAVVWCRQVDNEAESPGYTTVPEEFPGHRETLDLIRVVGNLTVNIADTHDYWDPDPTQPLSYYPNLFLYPAYGGRYTCVGRMFLSTEDRPRLGMKTLVLDTRQLLATGEFGATVLRWHASMGGARRDGGRPPPVPDPNLYVALGEGFLFHRGATDPVVVVASSEWEAAMQVIFDLVRTLPASLVALGAILAFPYFLPQPKTNIHEFAEQIPLALAMMRVGKGEAGTERHARRIVSWEGSSVAVRDVTEGAPSPTGRGKDSVPLVLQFVRDHNESKLAPIVQRVDAVELPRLLPHLTDPERQGGRDRRKEMWRIATAMESAALLLQKSRGRHVPVSQETAKRAQEYLQARVPAPDTDGPPEPAVVPAPAATATTAPSAPTPSPAPGVPPWLQRGPEPFASGARGENVPVSTSDDPSLLLKSSAPPSAAAPSPPPIASPDPRVVPPSRVFSPPAAVARTAFYPPPVPPPGATISAPRPAPSGGPIQAPPPPPPPTNVPPLTNRAPVPAPAPAPAPMPAMVTPPVDVAALRREISVDVAGLRREIEQSLTRYIDERLGAAADIAAQRSAVKAQESIRAELAQRTESQSSTLQESVERRAVAVRTEVLAEVRRQLGELEGRLTQAMPTAVAGEVDRKLGPTLEPKIAAATARTTEAVRAEAREIAVELRSEVHNALEEARATFSASEDALRAGLSAQLDLHLREAADREQSVHESEEGRLRELIAQRQSEGDQRRAREAKELEQRLGLLVDGRQREIQERLATSQTQMETRVGRSLDEQLRATEGRLTKAGEERSTEIQNSQVTATADLQVRLQSYADQKLREGLDREREKYLELLARLRAEVDATLLKTAESNRVDVQLRERIARTVEELPAETQRLATDAAAAVESRIQSEQGDQIRRLDAMEGELKDREQEIILLEQTLHSDLEDLERRTTILSERLVPVMRKTWLRISELEKRNPDAADTDYQVNQIRREVSRDTRRLEALVAEQVQEMRDRMETSIQNQGKVWLTLIQQLSSLTEGRRASPPPAAPAAPPPRSAPPEEPTEEEAIDAWLAPASRPVRPGSSSSPPPSDELSDLPDDPGPGRRRARRTPGR
jgi:hypothetical protein